MNLQDYMAWTRTTRVYPTDIEIPYLLMGLCGEVGELLNKYKKVLRGDTTFSDIRDVFLDEIGDCLWYTVCLADVLESNTHTLNISYSEENIREIERNPVSHNAEMCSTLFLLYVNIGELINNSFEGKDVIQDFMSALYSTLVELCFFCATTVAHVAQRNHDKLEVRKVRGTLKGSGDAR